jgi:hypothetical protein
MFLERRLLSGRLLLEGLQHAAEIAADRGHGRVVGAEGRLADRQRPLLLFFSTFPARQAVGMDAPSRRPGGTPTRTPGRTAAQGGLSCSSFVLPANPDG